jgi:hypothetical protein
MAAMPASANTLAPAQAREFAGFFIDGLIALAGTAAC